MIKDLKRYQIQLTPFQATKDWAVNNVDNDDLLLFESTGSDDGEPIDLEYIDYNPDSALNNYNCQIALEQQAADVISHRDGEQLTGPFYPDSDPTNIDGTYQRSVYSQIRTSFYNTYRNPTQIFGIENIDFERGKTKRRIAEKLRLFDVPRSVFGDKIIPSSVVIYDNSLDNDYTITDDGYGNLQAGTNLFSKQQEIGDFDNDFAGGYSSVCDDYFLSGIFTLTVVSGSAILNWTYTLNNQDYFSIQKSLTGTSGSYNSYSTTSGDLRTFTDTNVSGGFTYWYQVIAINTQETLSYSNTASITFTSPPAPTSSCKSSPFPAQLFSASLQTSLTYDLIPTASIRVIGDYFGPWTNGATLDDNEIGAWSDIGGSKFLYFSNVGGMNTTITSMTTSSGDFSISISQSNFPFVLLASSANEYSISVVQRLGAGVRSSSITMSHSDVSSPFLIYFSSL